MHHRMKIEDFLNFLDDPNDPLPSDTSSPAAIKFTLPKFVEAANLMAQSIKDQRESLLPLSFVTDV